MRRILLLAIAFVALAPSASAHCPLCTAGAGAGATVASALGVGLEVIGVFVGAFAMATGYWTVKFVRRRVSREYVPYQSQVIILAVYTSIVLPILPMMQEYTSIYVMLAGDYGSLLNRTYVLNTYLIGSIVGGAVVAVTPYLSKAITRMRDDHFPYQGISMTFVLLAAASSILYLVV